MEDSLTNFELSKSTVKIESNSGSDKSDNFEEIDDISSTGSNERKHNESLIANLPETVTILEHPVSKAKIYLVGTVHFSQESKDDVAKVIKAVQPNIVILELCEARMGILSLDEQTVLEEAKNINLDTIMQTIKKNGVYYGVTYLLLLNLSAHITKEIGMAPGGEFRVAYKEVGEIPTCVIQFGDRPIKITLLRALAKLSWWQTIKLGFHLLFNKDPISKEEVEKCKKRDMLEQLLAEMSGEYPTLQQVFVDERDIYLTYSLQQAALSKVTSESSEPLKIVGVVGIGHTLGIAKMFSTDQTPYIRDVIVIPPPTLTSKIIKVAFKVSILSFGGLLLYKYFPVPQMVRSTCHSAFDKIVSNIKHI